MIKKQLSALKCFNNITAIDVINTGLSSQCFKITADNKNFFAKKIDSADEVTLSLLTAQQGISPKPFYHDQSWLISQFIAGESLATAEHSLKEKINIAIKLMVQCHQITNKPIKPISKLSPNAIMQTLINSPYFPIRQQNQLELFAKQHIEQVDNLINTTYCHGDINFSNILITPNNCTWLVDFECACLAPIEYDLAMFIAVNNIEEHNIAIVIKRYQQQSLHTVDSQKLYKFLTFCYLINGIWYFSRYLAAKAHNKNHQQTQMKLLAQQQLRQLEKQLNTQQRELFSSLGIKF